MIVTLHLATGALAGAGLRSRAAALLVGPPLHLLGDLVPHGEMGSVEFETVSGVVALSALALSYGPFHPVTLAAAAAAAPDLEHVLPVPRPGGRAIFPSHRWPQLHKSGGISGPAQLLVAGALLAAIVRRSGRS